MTHPILARPLNLVPLSTAAEPWTGVAAKAGGRRSGLVTYEPGTRLFAFPAKNLPSAPRYCGKYHFAGICSPQRKDGLGTSRLLYVTPVETESGAR